MKHKLPALGLVLALTLGGCAITPPASDPSAPGLPGPSASPWPDPDTDHISRDDPTLPIHIQWPVLEGADKLTATLSAWAHEREKAFLEDNAPSELAPPELMGSWEAALAAGPLVGVRQLMYEFAGASGAGDSRTTYADLSAGEVWPSAELVRPDARARAVTAILEAVTASGRQPFEEAATSEKTQSGLLADLAFDAEGNLRVEVPEGLVTAFSDGEYAVTVPRATAEPLLSEPGRRIRDAYRAAPPTTVPTGPAAEPTSAAPTAATPTTAAPPTTKPATSAARPTQTTRAPAPAQPAPGASVDCSKLKCVALTFDDGPGPHTNKLLDHLDAAGAKATFFVLGSSVRVYPQVIKRQVKAGHAIGNHTFTHKQLTKLSPAQQKAEVDRTEAALAAAGAPRSTTMRPPYGSYNAATRELGLPIIMWDVDTLDWKNRNVTAVTDAALKGVKPGSIVLFHDIHPTTVEAMPGILKQLKAQGYTFVTVPQLLPNAKGGQAYTRR